MTVGESIRYYRKEKNLTQFQLADAVGVSAQAISKWETGGGMPDISQIIPLARAPEITTDQLLQYADKREELEKQWQESMRKYGDNPEQGLKVSLGALEEYPEDVPFLFRAAVDCHRLGALAPEGEERKRYWNRARGFCEKLISVAPEDEEGKHLLVTLYMSLGMEQEACRIAYLCQDRDRALKICLKGEALRAHRQKLVYQKLESLLTEMVHGEPDMLDGAQKIVDALVDPCYAGWYYALMTTIMWRKLHVASQSENMDQAKRLVSRFLKLARAWDEAEASPLPLFDRLPGPEQAIAGGEKAALAENLRRAYPDVMKEIEKESCSFVEKAEGL